jgi:NADH-quinone oxidoreductase subunit H
LVVSLKSKYAAIGANRLLLSTIFLEFLFYLVFYFIFFSVNGFSFDDVALNNSVETLIFFCLPISFFLLVYSLYEAKRAPFDHAEAESELVAGHIIEFGGKSLLFYFFSEYIHLFFLIFFVFLCVFGDANSICTYEFLISHDNL